MAEDFSFLDAAKSIGRVAGFVSNPVGSALSMVGSELASKSNSYEREEPQAMNPFEQQSRNMRMQSFNQSAAPVRDASFLGGLGQTLGDFGRDVGGFFQDVSPLTNLFGLGVPAPSSSEPGRRNGIGFWCRCVGRCARRRAKRCSSNYTPNEERRSKDLYDGWHGSECHGSDIK